MKKIVSLIVSSVLCFSLLGCSKNKLTKYTVNGIYFDTIIKIELFLDDSMDSDNEIQYIQNYLNHFDKISSRFESNSLNSIYDINNSNGEALLIDKDLYDMISYSIQNENEYFTIGIGSISEFWQPIFDEHNGDDIDSLPSPSFECVVDTSLIELENENENYYIKLPLNMKLDLGGIAKGYVLSKLSEYFNEKGIRYNILGGDSFIISNYGNPSRKNNDFLIGLIDPLNPEKTYAILTAPKDKAISTSADYQKYFIYNEKVYSSILDKNTRMPVDTDLRAVTVISSNKSISDITSTTIFMMGYEKGLEYVLENNMDAIFYLKNGSIFATDNVYDSLSINEGYKIERP